MTDLNDMFKRFTEKSAQNVPNLAEQGYHALLRKLKSADAALATVQDAIIQTDHDKGIVHMNAAAERLTGWKHAEVLGRNVCETLGLKPPGPDEATLRRGQPLPEGVFRVMRPRDGSERMVLVSMSTHSYGRIYVLREVRETGPAGSGLDALTGLPDRRMLEQRLAELLAAAAPGPRQLLYLDLDQFKVINDLCGHRAGDELLRRLTGQWQAVLQHGELLARLGGDEFCVVLARPGLVAAREAGERMIALAGELRFKWAGETFRIGASGGLVEFGPFEEPGVLLAAADSACWAAKEGGRNRLQVFDVDDEALMSRQEQMGWLTRITRALEEDRFVLYHQTIHGLDNGNGDSIHSEILLRMIGEDGGLIEPNAFIPAAERYNLMPRLDRWVVANVFAGLARRQAENPEAPLGVTAINLSGTTLNDEKFVDFLRARFEEHGIPPAAVCFELTETAAISNLDRATHFIGEVRALGCTISLDDFGSGVSSFAYLRALGVDYLKIDGTFVHNMDTDPVNYAMVEAIHRVGEVMNIPTVAEFVGQQGIADCLKRIGVNYAQGYHLHLPEPWTWSPQPAT